MTINEIEARSIPREIAVCPICGEGLWIEEISEASEYDDCLKPEQVGLTCETELDIDSDGWREWHRQHFSTPYID